MIGRVWEGSSNMGGYSMVYSNLGDPSVLYECFACVNVGMRHFGLYPHPMTLLQLVIVCKI